ncbi:hypothetical protein A8H37_33870 [Burkholderia thailandensis]|nr:hypothetical protein A8H37_33870 [Burkholderia thailandensis]
MKVCANQPRTLAPTSFIPFVRRTPLDAGDAAKPRACARRFALDRKPARESAHARVMRHAARECAAG